jgi:hypothetical protein
MKAPRGARIRIILKDGKNGRFLVGKVLKGDERIKTVEIDGKKYQIKQLGI